MPSLLNDGADVAQWSARITKHDRYAGQRCTMQSQKDIKHSQSLFVILYKLFANQSCENDYHTAAQTSKRQITTSADTERLYQYQPRIPHDGSDPRYSFMPVRR
jgi:hypothetical protein